MQLFFRGSYELVNTIMIFKKNRRFKSLFKHCFILSTVCIFILLKFSADTEVAMQIFRDLPLTSALILGLLFSMAVVVVLEFIFSRFDSR